MTIMGIPARSFALLMVTRGAVGCGEAVSIIRYNVDMMY
jgi:hypothetical protein